MVRLNFILVVAVVILCGCAATGDTFTHHQIEARKSVKNNSDYLAWEEFVKVVESKCKLADSAFEGHSLIVSIGFSDGTTYTSVEPVINDVMVLLRGCGADVRSMSILME